MAKEDLVAWHQRKIWMGWDGLAWTGAEEDVDGHGRLRQRRMWMWTAWAEDVDGLIALKRTMTNDE